MSDSSAVAATQARAPGMSGSRGTPVLLSVVGGAIDTIGFVALLGFFTAHVTGNLVLAGAGFVQDGEGMWIELGAIPLFMITVMVVKIWMDRSGQSHKTLGWMFIAEALFLCAFMAAGLYFQPFRDPEAGALALTGGLGLIALAVRHTASKTLIKHMSPTTIMTGNMTKFAIDLADYARGPSAGKKQALIKNGGMISGFFLGAFLGAVLYMKFGFWSVLPFIVVILYLATLAFRKQVV